MRKETKKLKTGRSLQCSFLIFMYLDLEVFMNIKKACFIFGMISFCAVVRCNNWIPTAPEIKDIVLKIILYCKAKSTIISFEKNIFSSPDLLERKKNNRESFQSYQSVVGRKIES